MERKMIMGKAEKKWYKDYANVIALTVYVGAAVAIFFAVWLGD